MEFGAKAGRARTRARCAPQICRPKVSSSALKIALSLLSTRHPSRRSMYTTACTSRSFIASFTDASPRADTWSPSSSPGVSRKLTVNPAAWRAASGGRSDSGWNGALCATRSLSTELSVELFPAPLLPDEHHGHLRLVLRAQRVERLHQALLRQRGHRLQAHPLLRAHRRGSRRPQPPRGSARRGRGIGPSSSSSSSYSSSSSVTSLVILRANGGGHVRGWREGLGFCLRG